MAEDKRYYWIKLRTDYFEDEKIDFLMSQKNGSDYIVLYQILCLKTANTDGSLCNQLGEMLIKWDEAKIQRECKYFSIDTIRVALELYRMLGLVYEEDNQVIKISNYESMVGSETTSAKKVREWREKKRLQCNRDVTYNVTQEIRDKRLEIRDKDIRDKEIRNNKNNIICSESFQENDLEQEEIFIKIILNDKTFYSVLKHDVDTWKDLYPNVDVEQELRNMVGWCDSHPSNRKTRKGIKAFINNWLSKSQNQRPKFKQENKVDNSNVAEDDDPYELVTPEEVALVNEVCGR